MAKKKRRGILLYLQKMSGAHATVVFGFNAAEARKILNLIDDRDRQITRLKEELEEAFDGDRYGELRE